MNRKDIDKTLSHIEVESGIEHLFHCQKLKKNNYVVKMIRYL